MALCLFCGRDEATLEHIIPKAMSRRLREVSPFTSEHGAPLPTAPGAQRFHHSKIVDLKVGAVCKRCNGQFFNKLQEESKPFWHSAIAGDPVELNVALKLAAATWAYKTALLLPLPGMPRQAWDATVGGLTRELRLIGRPQAGARVWSARYDLRDDFPEHTLIGRIGELHVRRRGAEYVGIHVLFTVGYMMFVVVYWPRSMPDLLPGEVETYPSSHFEALWPIYTSRSNWPPPHLYLYSEVEELVTSQGGAQPD